MMRHTRALMSLVKAPCHSSSVLLSRPRALHCMFPVLESLDFMRFSSFMITLTGVLPESEMRHVVTLLTTSSGQCQLSVALADSVAEIPPSARQAQLTEPITLSLVHDKENTWSPPAALLSRPPKF